MNNLGWALKPFSKLVGIAADSTATVELNDTNGDPIKCNYVTVHSSSDGTGHYLVRPGITYTNDTLEASAAGDAILAGSGAGCAIGITESSVPTTLRTSVNEFFEDITIDNNSTAQEDFVITYGVVYAANPLETLKITTRGK